jgi:tRNA threonylcarbamoyladenosine biosynthesis protein TsaB
VRLAASVTQGLAFGADLPVIPVSNLSAVAQRAVDLGSTRVLVCNDARMQEVYWACFERSARGLATLVGAEHVGPPEQVSGGSDFMTGAGRGFCIYPQLRSLVTETHDQWLPRAVEIVRLAVAGSRLPPEEAIPIYLRDDVARPAPS